ncbi:receptor-like protein 2 [Juglans microcarpa x Juglans regia]|uniref:receptor-like protein 2 n=1 Tax=Juglans microcarpa x Juglans regia TaxID=2249226 RepID=UPI001B7EB0E3|nr:receptor-like protein 2 [Juglans microcarpa x Juglans regia]
MQVLRAVRFALNQLDGQIPLEVAQLRFMTFFSITGNKITNITGAIKILMRCLILETVLIRTDFQYETMPTDDDIIAFNGSKNLKFLDIGGCQLTGELPIWLSKLKKLKILSLNANSITGSIPSRLSTLPRLICLDMSDNLISGTQLQSFDASAYEGNYGLCGAPLSECGHVTNGNSTDKHIQDEEDGHTIPWFHITVVVGFITGFWAVSYFTIDKRVFRMNNSYDGDSVEQSHLIYNLPTR